MRTANEMILAVHERMAVLERQQEKRRITTAGAGCAVLGFAVLFLIARFGGTKHAVLPAEYSGASLLADDIGGYILVALAAFMAGAAITALIRARRRKQEAHKPDRE